MCSRVAVPQQAVNRVDVRAMAVAVTGGCNRMNTHDWLAQPALQRSGKQLQSD